MSLDLNVSGETVDSAIPAFLADCSASTDWEQHTYFRQCIILDDGPASRQVAVNLARQNSSDGNVTAVVGISYQFVEQITK
jgi:hypothetical protein